MSNLHLIESEMENKILVNSKDNNRELKKSTVQSYISRIKTLYSLLDASPSDKIKNIFSNHKKVITFLRNNYQKFSSRASYLTAIIRMGIIYEYETLPYLEEQKKLTFSIKKQQMSQKLKPKEKQNWVDDETLKILQKQLDLNRTPFQQTLALLLTLFTKIPPRRREYGNVIVKGIETDKKSLDEERNYLIFDKNGSGMFYFGDYKTSGWYGQQKIRCPKPIVRRIKTLLLSRGIPLGRIKEEPDIFLFCKTGDPYTELGYNGISKLFETMSLQNEDILSGRKLSVNLMRHMYITKFFDSKGVKSRKARKRLATRMGHSIMLQEQYVRIGTDKL